MGGVKKKTEIWQNVEHFHPFLVNFQILANCFAVKTFMAGQKQNSKKKFFNCCIFSATCHFLAHPALGELNVSIDNNFVTEIL